MIELKSNREHEILHAILIIPCCWLILSMMSCEQNLNLEINTNDKRLLVSGEFTSDTTIQSVRLFCSGSILTGVPQPIVSGAKVIITDGVDTISYFESTDSPGLYQTRNNCSGIGGHIYTLHISQVDINGDGRYENYTARSMMPVPVRFDSMVSYIGVSGDGVGGSVINTGYYTKFYNGPDYLYDYVKLNSKSLMDLTKRLGNGDLTRGESEYKTKTVNIPGSVVRWGTYFAIEPKFAAVQNGDTISIVGLNFTKDQYEFLKEFDNSTTSGDLMMDNLYDQLKIPTNLPTNIVPSDKAAGYFFIYSISRIKKVFQR